MATFYTDNLTGNDTTGNGTIITPYKTILKALTVSANNDTINVAGSGMTALSGTLTVTKGSATIATSANLTTEAPVGTLISLDDPNWGNERVFMKVTAVTSNSITVNSTVFYKAGAYSARKLTTNHYQTATANTTFENFTTITNKTGINIQCGWTNNFTAQDGWTAFVYAASGNSGSASANFAGSNTGWTFNRIALGGMTWNNSAFGGGLQNFYGHFKLAGGSLFMNGATKASAGNSFGLFGATLFGNTYPTTALGNRFIVDNLWSPSSGGLTGSGNGLLATITNAYFKDSSNNATSFSTTISGTSYITINNLDIEWTAPNATAACFGPIIEGSYASGTPMGLIRNITESGNSTANGATADRAIYLKGSGVADLQIIMPSKNVDTLALCLAPGPNGIHGVDLFPTPVKDQEGEKQIFGMGAVIYADPTQYSTGTNSMRITRPSLTNGNAQLMKINSFYMPTPAVSKTITVRARATTNTTVKFGLMPNGAATNTGTATGYRYTQSFTVTSTWQDYTITLLQDTNTFNEFADSYVRLGVILEKEWASKYVWIDSVTIS